MALRMIALAVVYYTGARCGLMLEVVRGPASPLSPATGVALAGLLLWGLRVWPAISVAALLVNLPHGPSVLASAGISAGDTLAPLCAVLLLRRFRFNPALATLRDTLVLVFLGALTGMLVSATIGSTVLAAAGGLGPAGFWATWSVWWTGDAMGVLLVAPMLLILSARRWPTSVPPRRWAEAVVLVTATAAVASVVTRTSLNLPFLVFPCLVWAAYRFQVAGGVACALIVSVLAVPAAAAGSGPFTGHDVAGRMLILQALNGAVTLTSLVLATVVAERNRAHEQIAGVCAQLNELVGQLSLTARFSSQNRPVPDPRGARRRAVSLRDHA
ncbi:MASE1 domain-containing protein [Streptomyces sp. WMMC500]|uniref:MASE1 domain-containing protein n=1 Tax=Streptomyces sp. WMMC500 TaxID=3015154 RepID=UPI00248B77C9|nr:MASE1 domain-containing protein [Streptomyces sp. WMMC500]WBB61293.1 MASE1 domain-containing protein [Streptomyces sp. WMMC500]